MRLSIFTTLTNPEKRGDNWREALQCYKELADEVIHIIGDDWSFKQYRDFANHNDLDNTVQVTRRWPKEFSWEFIGQQFQRGYEACTGDWIIHADLDFLFHEKDFMSIRQACQDNNDQPALSFWKYQFVLPDRYNIKSRLVIAVNKGKFGNRIRFDSGGDLTQPSLDGQYISPNNIPEARVPIYNYEKLLKTKEQIADDQGRMERAWERHFGKHQMRSDGTNENALERWITAQRGKLNKPQEHIKLSQHPKYIQETIKNLEPEQWGYDAFGYMRSDYV